MQGLRGGFDAEETCAAPAGSVPTMEVVQSSGASGEIIHQMDASLLEVSPQGSSTSLLWLSVVWALPLFYTAL